MAQMSLYEKFYAPQIPNLVGPIGVTPVNLTLISLTFTANDLFAMRCIVPVGGTLKDLYIYNGATAAGTGIGVIYDAQALTPAHAASRPLLWVGTAVATTSANAWKKLGDPNLLVSAGQQIDMGVVLTDATCTIATGASTANAAVPDLPANFLPADPTAGLTVGASNILAWKRAAQGTPAATQPDASITAVVNTIGIFARVDPLY
jgi:hypothetical protein